MFSSVRWSKLTRPEWFHARANVLPLILLSFCRHLVLGKSFRQPQIKMKCETFVHLWAALFRITPQNIRFPSDIGARGAPPNSVSLHTGAPSQRSRPVPRPVVLHVLALPRALLTGPMISSSGTFQQRSPGRPVAPTALLQGGSSSLWKLFSSTQTGRGIPESTKTTNTAVS